MAEQKVIRENKLEAPVKTADAIYTFYTPLSLENLVLFSLCFLLGVDEIFI